MKTFRCNRPVNPAKLHDELVAAGIPVLTVRANQESVNHAAFEAVVVCEDSAAAGTVNAIVASHAHGKAAPTRASSEKGQADLEDGRGKGWLFIGSEQIV